MTEIKQGQIWYNKLVPAQKVRVNLVVGDTVFFDFLGSKEGCDCPTSIFKTFYELCAVSAKYKCDSTHEKGEKHDQAKPRFSLIPHQALWQVVAVLEFGAKKYGAENWRGVENARQRYFDACHRHLNAWWQGESVDDESGLPHLAHAVCCLIFLMSLGDR